jgi:hypothetical protein
MSKWVSVEQRAPDVGAQVIGWFPDGYDDGCMQIVSREQNGRRVSWHNTEGDELAAPTLWHPLPDSPRPTPAEPR